MIDIRNLPRDWQISRGELYSDLRYSPDQPRDDMGRWTDGDGGDGEDYGGESEGNGGGESQAPRTGAGSPDRGDHGEPSKSHEGASPRGVGGHGLLGASVKRTFRPTEEHEADQDFKGSRGYAFHELGEGGAQAFHSAIEAAKTNNPNGAAVTLYPTEDYAKMRVFLTDDGKAGFALKGDDIVSVFKDPGSHSRGVVDSIIPLAVQLGGRRLDCFDTALPSIYARNGFKAVSRTAFDPQYKPEGWSYDQFKAYNNGRPDVVFMVYDKNAPRSYTAGTGQRFPSYDEAMKHQETQVTEPVRAGDLFEQYNDPSASAGRIIASVPGAAVAVAHAEDRLKGGVATTAPVAEGGYVTPEDRYTPEREELHQQILSHLFNPVSVKAATPKEGEKPTLTVLGGRGGSGKSWFTKNGVVDAQHAIYINSDDLQDHLPGYEGWNAALYHDEAADITAQADDIARALGVSVIHDATMRRPGGTAERVKDYKAAGYKVEGHYMFLPPQLSTKRALERFVRGGSSGRFVPPDYLLGSTTNEKTFDDLKGSFDKWSLYENTGEAPKLVAESSK